MNFVYDYTSNRSDVPYLRRFGTYAVLSFLLGCPSLSSAKTPPAESQLSFNSPQDAVNAVITACKQDDIPALLKIFGPDGKTIVESGDNRDDQENRAKFERLAQEKNALIPDPMDADKMIVSIGNDEWPFPIPLIRQEGRWYFDTAAGLEEILARRIGSNELNAIEICHGYVETQFEFAHAHQQNGVPEYAQQIVSSPGKQDGLYWDPSPGAPECDIPKGFAKAAVHMASAHGEPYRGYYYRILTRQGPDARGGEVNYIVKGHMIGGFALIAWPAEYGASGVQTFIVNHDGIVYEKHLGRDTTKLVEKITTFNPDATWHPIAPEQDTSTTTDTTP